MAMDRLSSAWCAPGIFGLIAQIPVVKIFIIAVVIVKVIIIAIVVVPVIVVMSAALLRCHFEFGSMPANNLAVETWG